jgi:signal transduction histidine kinase/CHASE1-domain containing sensor protein
MTKRAYARGGHWLGPVLSAGVLVVGLVVTGLAVSALRDGDRDSARRVMDQRTAVARSAVTVETGRYLDLLQTVAAGAGTNAEFDADDFRAATAPLNASELVGATSVVFAVPTSHDTITKTETLWRSRGANGLVLRPEGLPQEHVFSVFTRSLNDNEPAAVGVDISISPEADAALNEARRTGSPTVSDTYVLLRDRDLPENQQQLSFAFVAPVYADPGTATGAPAFRGWIVMGLRGQDFLGGVLGKASQGLLDGELRATNGDGRQVRVAGYTTGGTRDLRRQATFPVANRQWTLITGADSENLPGARSDLPFAVLLGGIAITLMLAGLVHVLASGRARARAQVLVATADLREAEAESRRQAGLLGAIMASLGDGVGVIDGDGGFLLHNPAAKALLGIPLDVDGPDNWQQYYGMYRPDGRTPFPVDEMPLVRALHGESVDGVEMMIRNAARPDGILISVDGRPLDPSAGQPGAVAVFHDITELRRYEADLSVFAGVVAHDLKSPLAVIRGHCETAGDALAEGDGPGSVAEAQAAMTRIAIAVDRMASLIDTLLAYTTSRDAPLHLSTVPLGPLVADVVSERTAVLRPGDGHGPDIYVGPMPEVHVDPAMLRHVIDNLIGNALKYVQPGRSARIDVTAGPQAPGWVRVEIADRGIGIPEDDKPNIFESFHRAQTAAGYAGTGLGLAICRRIVERHGGAIGVTDNPGGGTRFSFTLPAAQSPSPVAATVPQAGPGAARGGGAAAGTIAIGSGPSAGDRSGTVAIGSGARDNGPAGSGAGGAAADDPAGALVRAMAERSDAERAAVGPAATGPARADENAGHDQPAGPDQPAGQDSAAGRAETRHGGSRNDEIAGDEEAAVLDPARLGRHPDPRGVTVRSAVPDGPPRPRA